MDASLSDSELLPSDAYSDSLAPEIAAVLSSLVGLAWATLAHFVAAGFELPP